MPKALIEKGSTFSNSNNNNNKYIFIPPLRHMVVTSECMHTVLQCNALKSR